MDALAYGIIRCPQAVQVSPRPVHGEEVDVAGRVEEGTVGFTGEHAARRCAAVQGREPDAASRRVLAAGHEHDERVVRRQIEVHHGMAGQELFAGAAVQGGADEVPDGDRLASRAGAAEEIEASGVRGCHGIERELLDADLAVARRIDEPDRVVTNAGGRDQRSAVRCDRDAFFLRRAMRELLRLAAREALTPDVERAAGVRAEVHPPSIRRPRRIGALGFRGADLAAGGCRVERDEPAGQPDAGVHFHDEHPAAVG